ncbi:hypothetical protein KUCAC02_010076 [Chaenocephalus aceratus]|uniref:Uncharacterized protein n=1 Tax=Chaenocephalus aceratus TaxID=36190 RepID=A0ACB9VYS2_CHAAC|nr:hypothetical protein KUCAC02_010076 [Chaenocephalus aceratus]
MADPVIGHGKRVDRFVFINDDPNAAEKPLTCHGQFQLISSVTGHRQTHGYKLQTQITLGSRAKKRFPSPLEAVAFAAGYEREPAN